MPTTNTDTTAKETRPVIGWEQESPVPDGHRFNSTLHVNDGRLLFDDLDLSQILANGVQIPGLERSLPSPLEIVYLPIIRRQIDKMNNIFAEAIVEVDYDGRFYYTYASKANAAEEVIRTTLGAGAHHEMSSTVDVNIARIMIRRGLLTPDRLVVCNGFKTVGTDYAQNIIRLKQEHANVLPVVEDLAELTPLIASGKPFDVGLRQKTYGPNLTEEQMEATDSRFGLNLENIWKAADYIAAAPNLNLRLYHAMVGSQILNKDAFVDYLTPGIEVYARLRKRYPTLNIFDFGGGMPAPLTLNFQFDHHAFAVRLLQTLKETCQRYSVPVPHVMGEFGRFTTAEHGAHLFKVISVKENNSRFPWYIIDGSIMSSFPDSWCLGEHFICLPLNHLDQPFQQVRLGGITCDSDDVYPPKKSNSPLFLPVEAKDLYLGFFGIGAYQEMLGGVKGSKHCVLPEAYELLVDRAPSGEHQFQILRGQTPADVLRNLGYQPEEST
ncbi:MAG: arginine decarboxylase [Chloroflexi bacterium]|jgi:arginine decarboxylase|nr:arginine decarboxylase [Chloroflexota bacterium]